MKKISSHPNRFNPLRSKQALWSIQALVILMLLLSGCKLPAPQQEQPDQNLPDAMFTAAAQTADARGILQSGGAPTPTQTPQPTALGEVAGQPTPTPLLDNATPAPGVPTDDTIPENDRAEFVDDITVPDGEAHAPGETFTKTWRLKNTGTTTWTTGYALIYISGSLMDAPPTVPLPQAVAPGETVDLSVDLVAPSDKGIFQAFWKLRNASGQVFGVGADGIDAFWVTISVNESQPRTTTTGTPAGKVITDVLVRIENPQRTGVCPQVFRITVEFSLSRATTITYNLEAGSQENAEIKLPPPGVRNMDIGSHTLVYELTFTSTIHGWVRIHFTQPEDVTSKQTDFVLDCQ
jgi:hypothetical protein